MKASKRPKTATTNEKPVSSKLLLASTKLVPDELLPSSSKVRSLENSSNQNDNDIRLPLLRADKRLRTTATNGKPVSGKLSLTLTKLPLRISSDVKGKKILTLKIS